MSFAIDALPQPRSLRERLMVWNSALVLALFVILGLVTYFVEAHTLIGNVQNQLNREVVVVREDVERQVQGAPAIWPDSFHIDGLSPYTAPGLTIEIIDSNQTLRGCSLEQSLQQCGPKLPISANADNAALGGASFTIEVTVQGQRTLVSLTPLYGAFGQIVGVAHVAQSLSSVDQSLNTLRLVLIIATLVALPVAVGGTYLLTRRALAPLATIATVANAITQSFAKQSSQAPQTLRMRVPPVDDEGELGELVTDVNRMLDSLSEYDERQRQFITDASHELRTPLTTIRGNLELVRRTPDLAPADREQALADAADESGRMSVLVNDLLSLARAESPQADQTLAQPVELDALLVEVFHVARERARSLHQDSMPIELTGLTPVIVLGDRTKLRQVLLNLVDNALKYAPNSTLTLAMTRLGKQVQIEVTDTGPGIAPADLPHIFDRFYRAERARDRIGSGLGLAIARTYVDQHGGTLNAISTPGKGTRFTITLPLQPGTPEPSDSGEE